MQASHRFVVASFSRCGHDNFARVLESHGLLDFYALATRRGTAGVSPEHTRLKPLLGLLNYASTLLLPPFQSESLRFRLYPFYDRWLKAQLIPGQHLITSFAFANESLRWIKRHGGLTFIDAQNSHPAEFWQLLCDEHKRWRSPYPPVSEYCRERSLRSVENADYIFTPSSFVRRSFLLQGFEERRVLSYSLPLNLEVFRPSNEPRPAHRPLTILNTGALCLRKGTPYLLEAFRLVIKEEPKAILRLSETLRDDTKDILRRYADLPIDWAPPLNIRIAAERARFVQRYQTSDIFVLPSIEDGFAFVVAEALACGLPVITTPNTGAADLITPGINGEIVPIRDPQAIASAISKWWARIRTGEQRPPFNATVDRLRMNHFEGAVLQHLAQLGIEVARMPQELARV